MTRRASTLCPHCLRATYLLQAKAEPTMVQPIGKGLRVDVSTGAIHWNCPACTAEHILEYDIRLAKGGAPALVPRVRTLPPAIPTLPIREERA